MTPTTPKCACGCGLPVGPKPRRGPSPLYATPACRKRAERRRNATSELEPLEDRVHGELPTPRPNDEQVAQAVLEARSVGYALTRLGTTARPEFAWRCETLGSKILTALKDTFGEVIR